MYADNGKGAPGSLVRSSDTGPLVIPPSTKGIRTTALNGGSGVQLVGPAWYWLGFEADSTAESLYSIASAVNRPEALEGAAILGATSAAAIFDGTVATGVSSSHAFGACPSTFESPSLVTGAATPYLVMGY